MNRLRPSRKLALRVLAKLRLLEMMRLHPRVAIGRRDLVIPVLNGTGYANLFEHEPWLDRVLRHLLAQRKGTFIDVGVNIGQTLLKYLESASDEHRYVGFEPNPSCLNYLEELRGANTLESVQIVPTGLSDRNGVISLFLSSDVDSAGSAVEGFRPSEEYSMSKIIPVLRGDDVVSELQIADVAIIKIDVEGGELEVLRGLMATIRSHRPFVICEILPVYDTTTTIGKFRRQRVDEVEELMHAEEYACFRLLHDGTFERIEHIETHDSLDLCEYLFVHETWSGALTSIDQG